mgnify:CR=1 FL=1|tara:strand:+ start:120 stop:245 length:126 start_codon:yes stop_codon:yes gene_type:complete
MLEFIKHLFGFCGEPHPNIITLILGAPIFSYIYYKIKNKNK